MKPLTPKQRVIHRLVTLGCSYAEIAALMPGMSYHAVYNIASRINVKAKRSVRAKAAGTIRVRSEPFAVFNVRKYRAKVGGRLGPLRTVSCALPVHAIRKAGLEHEKQLAYRVDGGTIFISKVSI